MRVFLEVLLGFGVYPLIFFPLRVASKGPVDQTLVSARPWSARTWLENAFQDSVQTEFGPQLLGLIGGAVLFAIFFAVLNTMLLTGRERTRDLGVMKALGFGNGVAAGLLIGESLLLCATGAGLAVAVALGLEQKIAESTAAFIPGFALDGATLTFGAGVALVLLLRWIWKRNRSADVADT